ncbi:MAG: hypothetical protein R3F33_11525 [Planctomycetota bacterium]
MQPRFWIPTLLVLVSLVLYFRVGSSAAAPEGLAASSRLQREDAAAPPAELLAPSGANPERAGESPDPVVSQPTPERQAIAAKAEPEPVESRFRGRVILPDGTPASAGSGHIVLGTTKQSRYVTVRKESVIEAEVQDLQFDFEAPPGAGQFRLISLELDGRRWRQMARGIAFCENVLEVRVQPFAELLLEVRDAESLQHISGVRLCETGPADRFRHPDSLPEIYHIEGRFVSPIRTASQGPTWSENNGRLWVGADGYGWQLARVNLDQPTAVVLQPAGTLWVSWTTECRTATRLVVQGEGDLSGTRIEWPLRQGQHEQTLANIPAGALRVQLEPDRGTAAAPPIAYAVVDLSPGANLRVDLEDLQGASAKSWMGRLRLDPTWKETPSVKLYPRDKDGSPAQDFEVTPRDEPGTFAIAGRPVGPGTYGLVVEPMDYTVVLTVGELPPPALDVFVPALAEVVVVPDPPFEGTGIEPGPLSLSVGEERWTRRVTRTGRSLSYDPARGRWTGRLLPGEYMVFGSGGVTWSPVDSILRVPEEMRSLHLRWKRNQGLELRFLRNGEPIREPTGLKVEFVGGPRVRSGRTWFQGETTLRGVESPGRYRVRIGEWAGMEPIPEFEVEIPQGEFIQKWVEVFEIP